MEPNKTFGTRDKSAPSGRKWSEIKPHSSIKDSTAQLMERGVSAVGMGQSAPFARKEKAKS